ncbi:MAG TPA: hypothetical protein V6D33_14015, partial [Cyanophyceae cyanobacterium]
LGLYKLNPPTRVLRESAWCTTRSASAIGGLGFYSRDFQSPNIFAKMGCSQRLSLNLNTQKPLIMENFWVFAFLEITNQIRVDSAENQLKNLTINLNKLFIQNSGEIHPGKGIPVV